jgi:hypothetical protein
MAFDYARAQATAERLIANFGQAATLTKTANTSTAYNPTRTATPYACTVAVLDFRNSEIDGTLIKQGDKKVYVSTRGLAVVPAVHDTITIANEVHAILAVMPLAPAGTVVYWEVQARR